MARQLLIAFLGASGLLCPMAHGHQQPRCFISQNCIQRLTACEAERLQDGGWNALMNYRIGKRFTCVTNNGLESFWTEGDILTLYATGSPTFYTMPSKAAALTKCEKRFQVGSSFYKACEPVN